MKRVIVLNLLLILMSSNFLNAQEIKANGFIGMDEPEYLVMYEVISPKSSNNCNESKNTILFEIPTTREYYDSIRKNQEVTSWFKVFGDENEYLSGSMAVKDKDRWKLIIRNKRIITKGDIE